MISIREARYCNLKLFLIYLVILGHLIEPMIEKYPGLYVIYAMIYSFHMPLFAFLTGLFVKNENGCKKQGLRLLKLYIPLQLLAVVLGWGKVSVFKPYWHLWYLLSAATWMLMTYLWFHYFGGRWSIPLLLLSLLTGCAAGYIPMINRELSLSRTLVFFPYFFAGVLTDPGKNWQKLRLYSVMPAFLAVCLLLHGLKWIPVEFLYQADSCSGMPWGALYRLAAYGIGGGCCMFLLAFLPGKRYFFTKYGTDTLPAYIAHAPIVLLLGKLPIPWYFMPMISAALLYLINGVGSLYRDLYGISHYHK